MGKVRRAGLRCAFPYPVGVTWLRKRDHNPLTNAASLLICGLLAGVVVAAAAFPAVAMSGLAAKAAAETFDKLPTELTVKRAPQISYLYASDGKTVLATMFDENRRDIPIKDIPQVMQQAIVAAEDHNFYKHNGVDMKGVVRAFVNNSNAGTQQQGASTLTMQYVRMAISYSASRPRDVVAATEDTTARKLKEMRYAMQIDKELGKDGVLERYLNIAPFGNGAYGVYAASQVYFGKKPKDLKIEEAAMLAGMVKAPDGFDPTDPEKYPKALDRRNYVIDNMREIGAITPEQAATAKATKLVVKGKPTPNGCVAANKNQWGFFCDYFYRWWLSQETFGATAYDRERRLKTGGYRIVTSLDLQAQQGAKDGVERSVPTGKKEALMVAAVEPGSGRVRALATNRNYKLDNPDKPQNKLSTDPAKRKLGIRGTYPNTTNPLLTGGGDIHGYQAGSTFKMFTMIAALENGYSLNYGYNAPNIFKSDYVIQKNSPAACLGTHFYCPGNASPNEAGRYTMWGAFGRSINTYFVPLEQAVGADKAVEVAKRLGIKFTGKLSDTSSDAYLAANAESWGAFTLGVSATTPLDLANAYATVAADGTYCEPIPVEKITDQDGNNLDVANPRCKKALKTEVARAALDAARCPVGDRSATSKCVGATASAVRRVVGKPVAGKTGTTDHDKTAALVAMTKQYSFAGILADPDWPQTTERMRHEGKGGVNPAVYEALRDAMKGKPAIEFPGPGSGSKMVQGDEKTIPSVRCYSLDNARAKLKDAGFEVRTGDGRVDSSCPAGSAAGTNPDGKAPEGAQVVIQVSNGKNNKPADDGGGSGDDPGNGNGPGTGQSPSPPSIPRPRN